MKHTMKIEERRKVWALSIIILLLLAVMIYVIYQAAVSTPVPTVPQQ